MFAFDLQFEISTLSGYITINKIALCLAAKRVLDASVRVIFGTEASDISLLYYLTYVAAAGGLDPLISSRKNYGGQELKVVVSFLEHCLMFNLFYVVN